MAGEGPALWYGLDEKYAARVQLHFFGGSGAIGGGVSQQVQYLPVPRFHVPQIVRVLHAPVCGVNSSLDAHHDARALGNATGKFHTI